jgi:hypothetical protein
MQARRASPRQVMTAIEGYLRDRPGAADSVEGVALWWLREAAVIASLETVREALSELEKLGTVRGQVMLDGRTIYQAAEGWPEH